MTVFMVRRLDIKLSFILLLLFFLFFLARHTIASNAIRFFISKEASGCWVDNDYLFPAYSLLHHGHIHYIDSVYYH